MKSNTSLNNKNKSGLKILLPVGLIVILTVFLIKGTSLSGKPLSKEYDMCSRSFFAMDTFMQVQMYENKNVNKKKLESLLDSSEELILEYERLISVTDENSEISRLNREKHLNNADEKVVKLLKFALSMCEQTQGALDISIYPLVKEWGFTTDDKKVPSKQAIASGLQKVDYKRIVIEGNNISIPEDMMIDLGAVAKGYVSEEMAQLFRNGGVTSGLINLGGNVVVIGTKPDGSNWRTGVQSPLPNGGVLGAVGLCDTSVVTSGDYQRFFEENGKRYHHIIDPSTGYPADNGLNSVSIIGKNPADGDALSTALFVMGIDKAIEYYRNNDGFEAVFVVNRTDVYITEGLKDNFVTLSDYEGVEPIIIYK